MTPTKSLLGINQKSPTMLRKPVAEIYCDGMDGDCPEVFSAPNLDLKSFFEEFRLEGWRKKSGFRYCPNCVERENIKVMF